MELPSKLQVQLVRRDRDPSLSCLGVWVRESADQHSEHRNLEGSLHRGSL